MEGKESEAGEQTGGQRNGGELALRLRIRGQGVLLEPREVHADEGDEENVGVKVAVQGEADQRKERFGEANRQDHGANRQKPELAPEQWGKRGRGDGVRGGYGFGDQGSGGVVEWWSGGVVEWWSGGVVEWWSGG